jgi:drug/metabolite transporter (DMT)-like permease
MRKPLDDPRHTRALLRAVGLPQAISPFLLLTLAALFWGGNVVLGRAVAERIPPITLNSLRWAIALAILAPATLSQLRGKGHLIRKWFVPLVILAIPSVAIYNSFIYLGTQTTTATNAGLIVGTVPMAIMVIASLIGQDGLTPRRAAGALISFAGVAWVVAKGNPAAIYALSFAPGDLLIIGSMLSWAIYTVLLRQFAIPLQPVALLGILSAIGLVVTLPFCAWELVRGARVAWSPDVLAAVAYVGIFPSVVATIFWNKAVAEVGACTAGLFFNLVPIFVVTMAIAFLAEPLRPFHLVGASLIFAGIGLATGTPLFFARSAAAHASALANRE